MTWLVSAGLHPKANATTLQVARDLARRMDYRRGIVLYDMEGTSRRTGASLATVKRHIAILRELGALVWLVHGSKRNLRLPGRRYTATATVYGAVIPPVYDAAMGHRISGDGYEARVIGVTEAGRERAIITARQASTHKNATRVSRGREPHSLGRSRSRRKAEVSGGLKDTSRVRARRQTPSPAPSTTLDSRRRSPWQAARDIAVARQVRARVTWTQGEELRRLAYVLRPLIDQGLDDHGIAAELHSWYLTWRPARPAAYIAARLKDQLNEQSEKAARAEPMDNSAWRSWCAQRQRSRAIDTLISTARVRTDADRRAARLRAHHNLALVLHHIDEHGQDDAFDLYGSRLTAQAVGLNASSTIQLQAPAWT